MRYKATKARAAQSMDKRPSGCSPGSRRCAADRVAKLRFPDPAPCGKTPLTAAGLSKSYGSLEVFTDVDLAIDQGSRVVVLGLNGAGQDDAAAAAGRGRGPGHRRGRARPRAAARLLRAGARDARHRPHRAGEHALRRTRPARGARCGGSSGRSCSPGTTSTSRPASCPAGRRPGSRWRPSSCPAPTCCCSTSRPTTSTPRAGRRCSARCGPTRARSCSSPTTRVPWRRSHPERLMLLPDGVEDHWSEDYADLVALA